MVSSVARSNTLPPSEPRRSQTTKKSQPPQRSATVINHSNSTKTRLTSPPATHSNPKHSIFHRHEDASTSRRSASSATLPRPGLPTRQNSVQTRYMTMLLALDTIPRFHNILASFFTWILLAGFVIFPGTFTSLSKSLNDDDAVVNNAGVGQIIKSVKNIPLLAIAGTCCGIGAAGMVWLWWRWRENYVWLLNRIFLPGTLNSLAGLISTLVNVYTQQDSKWSITARVTAIVTGACMVVTALLFALYNFWVLRKVRSSHERDMQAFNEEGEGFIEKIERKANQPALEPGSVV